LLCIVVFRFSPCVITIRFSVSIVVVWLLKCCTPPCHVTCMF
jgi:hypothetical protein